MRLGVAAALVGAGLEVQVHLLAHLVDDVLQRLLLPVEDLLLGERRGRGRGGLRFFSRCTSLATGSRVTRLSCGTEERLEPALDVQADLRGRGAASRRSGIRKSNMPAS